MDASPASLHTLRTRLEARARELAEEVSSYPSPIARCDEQLPGLIEKRSRAMALARRAAELESERERLPDAEWRAHVAQLESEATGLDS